MGEIEKAAENIWLMDNNLFSIPRWGSTYLINEDKKALVESGPTLSVPYILDGIKQLEVKPEEIDYLIVTHVHLDHAGGAGALIKHLPNAQIIVHHKGARHLIDPTRLLAGAIQARGNEVVQMHGEVFPVDAERVISVNEGDEIRMSDRQTLTFLDTPGHASHHICIAESRNGGFFSGDILSLWVADVNLLLPYHPPPQFDLELCLGTLERLEKMNFSRVYYSHYGVSEAVNEHISRVRDKLLEWDSIIRQAAADGTFGTVKERLIEVGMKAVEVMKDRPELSLLYDYFVTRSFPMNSEGHLIYYRKLLGIG